MILISISSTGIQSQQDLSTPCSATMTPTILAPMICSWEEKKFFQEPRESMTLKYSNKEPLLKESTLQLSVTISKASNTEPTLMEEEVSDWREWSCCTAHWKIFVTHLCSHVTPSVLLLDVKKKSIKSI